MGNAGSALGTAIADAAGAAESSVDFRVGRYRIRRVEEMLTPGFAPDFLFPSYEPAVLQRETLLAAPNFFDTSSGKLMSSMHSWLVSDGSRNLLIDTGCGNGKRRDEPMFARFHELNTDYLGRLAALGLGREDIDTVICTHLHIDHVGWNTMREGADWVPTFPRARYLFNREEYAHWRSPSGGMACLPQNGPVIADSVMPVVDAGLVDWVSWGDEIFPGLRVSAGPGHTAAQMFVWLEDGGDAAVFSGDSLHQPMQVFEPHWNSRFCEQADVARSTRSRLLADAAERNALVCPAHFGWPHAGRVAPRGDGFAFLPETAGATR